MAKQPTYRVPKTTHTSILNAGGAISGGLYGWVGQTLAKKVVDGKGMFEGVLAKLPEFAQTALTSMSGALPIMVAAGAAIGSVMHFMKENHEEKNGVEIKPASVMGSIFNMRNLFSLAISGAFIAASGGIAAAPILTAITAGITGLSIFSDYNNDKKMYGAAQEAYRAGEAEVLDSKGRGHRIAVAPKMENPYMNSVSTAESALLEQRMSQGATGERRTNFAQQIDAQRAAAAAQGNVQQAG